jgi:hypothetical protein
MFTFTRTNIDAGYMPSDRGNDSSHWMSVLGTTIMGFCKGHIGHFIKYGVLIISRVYSSVNMSHDNLEYNDLSPCYCQISQHVRNKVRNYKCLPNRDQQLKTQLRSLCVLQLY